MSLKLNLKQFPRTHIYTKGIDARAYHVHTIEYIVPGSSLESPETSRGTPSRWNLARTIWGDERHHRLINLCIINYDQSMRRLNWVCVVPRRNLWPRRKEQKKEKGVKRNEQRSERARGHSAHQREKPAFCSHRVHVHWWRSSRIYYRRDIPRAHEF